MADINTAYKTMTHQLNDAMKKENEELTEENRKLTSHNTWWCEEGGKQTYQKMKKENEALKNENCDLVSDRDQLLEICDVDCPEEAFYYISEL
jgi:cell division protein FtsB